jgi:hypothetical protein
MNLTKKPTGDEVIASLSDYEPSVEDAIAIHAKTLEILHQALTREYIRRRVNLKNAGQSARMNVILRSIQEDVRAMVSLGIFTDEQKAIIQFAFSKWSIPRDVSQVRLPVIK